MRKHRLFTKPTKVSDVIQEDLNSDISSTWDDKVERLNHRRWHKIRFHKPLFSRKPSVRRRNSWRNDLGHLMET